MELTQIQSFYKNKTILITGTTGFVGKLLVEKLLRSCSDLERIILPIRQKGKKSMVQRMQDYFTDRIFDNIKENKAHVIEKVVFMNANLKKYKFGLNDEDYNLVKTSVNIIIHSAAQVKFNASLKNAVESNILITMNIIDIAKDLTQLNTVIFLSTIYSHIVRNDCVEEKVHKLPCYKPEFLINLVENLEEKTLNEIRSQILGPWPNTYTMTKYVSERFIERETENLPWAIFRVPIVLGTYKQPIPGWVNGLQTTLAAGHALATGMIQTSYSNVNYNTHMVPADLVANAIIALAWYTATHNQNKLKVYNYSCVTNPLIRKQYYDSFVNTKYPMENMFWKPGYLPTNSKKTFDRYILFYHTIPAYITDAILMFSGQKPIFKKTMKKVNKMLNETAWAILPDLKIEFKNIPVVWQKLQPEDKELFNFDVNSIHWDDYMDIFTKSAKQFYKEDFSKMDKCEQYRYLLKSKF